VPVGAGPGFAAKYKTQPGEKRSSPSPPMETELQPGPGLGGCHPCALTRLCVLHREQTTTPWAPALPEALQQPVLHHGRAHHPRPRVNGMNVLAVKQAMTVREWCSSGQGPHLRELTPTATTATPCLDPGTTYRTRDEVGGAPGTPSTSRQEAADFHNSLCTPE
jgi:hypothetical protein